MVVPCSHLRIDNRTWRCVECGEAMTNQMILASRREGFVVGYEALYDCARCYNPKGVTFTPYSTVYGCGRDHRGGLLDR